MPPLATPIANTPNTMSALYVSKKTLETIETIWDHQNGELTVREAAKALADLGFADAKGKGIHVTWKPKSYYTRTVLGTTGFTAAWHDSTLDTIQRAQLRDNLHQLGLRPNQLRVVDTDERLRVKSEEAQAEEAARKEAEERENAEKAREKSQKKERRVKKIAKHARR
ncbi:hypothetical protein L227DRAFT_618138 [Lentinus tigrinus ALCF2SS1-6]|uniref:Uncharacterized protein n=1 Tax=Lentinus tigrinus ALCF2SS1-6 TaxID=1328759 RepID=A0A5C2RMB2_9APHY|nr:hypothetical protein L227DRAFT_618138 [Lentinus tigrinus ALCF2SS1-6]